ncbi:MAG: hypothetical protein GY870_20525 [archaeon]|nr:hypothetical protein [archaeon]
MSEEEIVSVKVLMNAIGYASQQIALVDEEYKNKLNSVNASTVYKVADDYIFVTEINDGKISSYEGSSPLDATVTIEFNDYPTALAAMTGRIDLNAPSEKIKITGDEVKMAELSFILESVKEYIGGMA